MASRRGLRPHGTDGNDFGHREKVLPQYNASPFLKRRIKIVYTLHFLVWLLVVIKLIPELCLRFGFNPKPYIGEWPLPRGELWEYVWCVGSLSPSLFGYLSLARNRTGLMRFAMVGELLFGWGPVLFASAQKAFDLMDYYYTRQAKEVFFGFPMVVLWYMFFSVCLQIHGFSLYFGWKLIKAWATPSSKKRS